MATPRMRTFVSGLVLASLAVCVKALSPGPAAADGSRAGRADPLPDSFTWSSTGPLLSPKPDTTHPIVSVRDPTVFRSRGRWHVYATTAGADADADRVPGVGAPRGAAELPPGAWPSVRATRSATEPAGPRGPIRADCGSCTRGWTPR